MALFTRKPKKEAAPKKTPKTEAVSTDVAPKAPAMTSSLAHVLRSPRITEKASLHMEKSAYVFDIAPNANKRQISAAIFAIYKVKPRKVAIVNFKPKESRNMRTGKSGMKGGGKKAYVYLAIGETITIA